MASKVVPSRSGRRTREEATSPLWLDPEERTAWLALNRLVTLLPSVLDAQLERDAGLNYFEYLVLAMLSEQPSYTVRMSELAAAANASLSRLSHIAKRLEGRGLLHRAPDPDDGRSTLAVLTDAGLGVVVAAAPGHVSTVRALVLDALTPAQLRELTTAHRRILNRIEPVVSAPARR